MKVSQIAGYVNSMVAGIMGENATVVADDLSNIVEAGKALENFDDWQNKMVKGLVDRIGYEENVDFVYKGDVPSIRKTATEYGSIMGRWRTDLPEASDNDAWFPQDGSDYSPDIYKGFTARVKLWNGKKVHEVFQSFPDYQLKSSFESAEAMAKFFGMIHNHIANSLTLQNQTLIYATVRAMIGEVLASGKATQKVNLLAMYNDEFGTSLTAAQALHDSGFIRYAILTMSRIAVRMHNYSVLFNNDNNETFTPAERLKIIMHTDFKSSAGVYLYNAPSQFKIDYLSLPDADVVPYWQSPGDDFAFANTSLINGVMPSGTTVNQAGVLAVMFDDWAAGVCNETPRVDTHYNPRANFTNYWYKREALYYTDTGMNTVVFYIA